MEYLSEVGVRVVASVVGYLSLDNDSIIPDFERQNEAALMDRMNHMDSTLYDAVIEDNIDNFKAKEGTLSVRDELTPTNSTVLHLACQYGSINCVKHILSVHEPLLLKINSRGDTVLHLAARQGHYEVVEELFRIAKSSLLKSESIINSPTINPYPRGRILPLFNPNLTIFLLITTLFVLTTRLAIILISRFCNHGRSESSAIQFLIRTSNVECETALHDAVQHNHRDVVQLLVDEDPSYSHTHNKYDETPLYMASTRCYTDIIRTISSTCISPNFGGPDGRTALHAVVLDDGGRRERGILQISECVKLLLDKNKDLVKVQDDYGWTVFHYVAYNDLHTIVEDLVGAGADRYVAYLQDYNDKRTALHVAAYKGNVPVMKKLVEHFPDCWETVDGNSQNILHIAVEQDRKEVIRYIFSQGCKAYSNLLIQRDTEGNTPLHLITKLGCYVKELMDDSTLDWEVLNNKNLTPLDLIHCGTETDTKNDQAKVKKTLVSGNVKKHWKLLHTLKETDIEKANKVVIQNEKDNKEVENYKKWISTHMVVAALITTVALTAGFTMPGGFDTDPGRTQGSAILLRKLSFRGFIITDTIALLCSISSLFLYFMTTMYEDLGRVRKLFFIAVLLNTASIITIMLAFITGTYSVLDNSPALAISITAISCSFLFIAFLVFVRMLGTVFNFFSSGAIYRYIM